MKTLKLFFDKGAWLLILLGSCLFGSRIAMPADSFINLPFLETAIQICGGMFILSGFALISSRVFWPDSSTIELLSEVRNGNVAAGVVLAGLKVFNGLAIIGFAVWLALSFGAGVSAR